MFYVIYNPDTKLYLHENGYWGQYIKAEQFNYPSPTILAYVQNHIHGRTAKWVGPCRVGEEP